MQACSMNSEACLAGDDSRFESSMCAAVFHDETRRDLRAHGRLIGCPPDVGGRAMGESELIGIIRDSNVQYASLFGQMITINFAMIVAIYYFLHRASVKLRLA